MDVLESKGKTVDEAVFNGLLKMDMSIDEVDIEILDEGGGLFKSAKVRLTRKPEEKILAEQEKYEETPAPPVRQEREPARQERDFRPRQQHERKREERPAPRREPEPEREVPDIPREPKNDAEKFLYGLFSHMGMNVALESSEEDGIMKVDISGRGMGMLIGRRGETLDALQYLTSLVINNNKQDYTKVMLDTENYRKKREDTLKRLAARLADKVQKSGRKVVLEPMNPYERRILHATLQDYAKVYTYSEGEDPYRSVVVALKGKDGEQAAEPAARPAARPRQRR